VEFSYDLVVFFSGFDQASTPPVQQALVVAECRSGHILYLLSVSTVWRAGNKWRVVKRDKSVLKSPPKQLNGVLSPGLFQKPRPVRYGGFETYAQPSRDLF
jgi:hypothetical protein